MNTVQEQVALRQALSKFCGKELSIDAFDEYMLFGKAIAVYSVANGDEFQELLNKIGPIVSGCTTADMILLALHKATIAMRDHSPHERETMALFFAKTVLSLSKEVKA